MFKAVRGTRHCSRQQDLADFSCLAILIDHEATLDFHDGEGLSLLWYAARYARADCLRLLARKGASPDYVQRQRPHDSTLHMAADYGHLDVVKALIDSNVNTDALNDHHETALHCAANQGHVDIVRVLMDRGVDIDVRNQRKETALDRARRAQRTGRETAGHRAVCELLEAVLLASPRSISAKVFNGSGSDDLERLGTSSTAQMQGEASQRTSPQYHDGDEFTQVENAGASPAILSTGSGTVGDHDSSSQQPAITSSNSTANISEDLDTIHGTRIVRGGKLRKWLFDPSSGGTSRYMTLTRHELLFFESYEDWVNNRNPRARAKLSWIMVMRLYDQYPNTLHLVSITRGVFVEGYEVQFERHQGTNIWEERISRRISRINRQGQGVADHVVRESLYETVSGLREEPIRARHIIRRYRELGLPGPR